MIVNVIEDIERMDIVISFLLTYIDTLTDISVIINIT